MLDCNDNSENESVTTSTALLNKKLGTSPGHRMLTPSEIVLLQKSKQEIAARLKRRGQQSVP